MFKKVDVRQSLPKMEEEVLKYWEANNVFEKSVSQRAGAPVHSFYDGPPFATGTPHYGHIVGQTLKDAVPRYWTMRGFAVERKWGWDCHGLPIENIAEKALGVKQKKDIEAMGVDVFNEFCRSTVLEYTQEWKKVTLRLGRWADREHAYKTMDKDYMESVWWVFKQLWDKGLIYESYRIMYICTRCETTLSQSEVSEGYADVKDLSATVKFELIDESRTFVLAWTTTPWTLPGNVALAVGEDIEYIKIQIEDESFILAKLRVQDVMKEKEYAVVEEILGKDLIGKKYLPPFDSYRTNETLENHNHGWKIYGAKFVTDTDGTGVVHIAPAFGEDDMELAKAEKLPFVQHVGMDGSIKDEVKELAGLIVKSKENPQATDIEVIKYLAGKELLFAKEKYEHSYPHCWRCDTPLINYATSSWFVKVTDVKEKALKTAKEINWSPEHVKAGRFGKWLSGARDWSISRQRFWASVIPVWKCELCAEIKVMGSVKELEDISGEKVEDLHKHIVDKIVFKCITCEGFMKRIPDVLDTWFDSGSMPFAQQHYPFENVEKFEASFPAKYIAEGIDQTRAWFYYLHVLSTAITEKPAFENVIVNGIVLAQDGKKMSKRLNNYPDPMLMFEKHGADAMRLYLLSSPIVSAENLNFSEKDMSEISRNVFRMLWNSYSFFTMYAEIDGWKPSTDTKASDNILDKWMLSELQLLIKEVNGYMEGYDMMRATRAFAPCIDHLSNWYIRRSRKRFWKSEDDADKNNAYQTLHTVLTTLAKLMAPFTPFIAEEIYRNLTGEESVHLADYPVADERLIDENLNKHMQAVRDIITIGLQKRTDAKIKVRQPLNSISLGASYKELFDTIFDSNKQLHFSGIVREELNVKKVSLNLLQGATGSEEQIMLDTTITPELKLEGQAREIIRFIQETRKEAGFEVDDRIEVRYEGFESVFENPDLKELIEKEVLAEKGLYQGEMTEADIVKETIIDDIKLTLWLKR
jgi:isoleucyl-tRNA synthetase